MNKKITLEIASFLLIVLMLGMTACLKDKDTKTYTIYRPVYKDKNEVLANVGSHAAKPVSNPGKIYLYGQYIFLNEINMGVHIIDNANPSSPRRVAFIDIPGNIDMAVKNNILYADLFTDMLAIDITDPLKARVTKRIENVFPERNYGNGFMAEAGKFIVDWTKKDTTVAINNDMRMSCANCGIMFIDTRLFSAQSNFKSSSAPGVGVAGSMSRFAIVNNYLYTVNNSTLSSHDITNASDPQYKSSNGLGWNIETIYPFKDKLFIGSASGMFIFDITAPDLPVYQSAFIHANACDPVVADDQYAYVTLRAGTFCQGTSNQLDVINVENIQSPKLVRTYQLENPHGLGKDGNLLWICDGTAGLKLFDATKPADLKQIKTINDIEAFDVIPWNGKMIVTCKEGLYQYDYSNLDNIRLLSKMPVN